MWMTYLQDGVLADQNLNREQSAWESEVSTLHQEKGSTESFLIMQYSSGEESKVKSSKAFW